MLTRRQFAQAAAATALLPASRAKSQSAAFSAAFDRARSLDQLRSLVIGRDGEVLAAEALRGPSVDTPANVKSVSKTIVATMAGIGIDRRHLPGTDATLGDLAPGLIPGGADPRVSRITVADLLTMQAGLERTSGANYGPWVNSRNWVSDALSRPMVAEPGSRMQYSTGSYHVLGAVLTEATGRSLHDLAVDWLGGPLGIQIPPWTRDPQGRFMGGNQMALSPVGMFRFGDMFRSGGMWQSRRVVSDDWVERALTPRTRSIYSGHEYGFGWFLASSATGPVAYARGYGGQMIYILPELNLTVAITSDPNLPARSRGHAGDLFDLVSDVIAPEAQAL